MGTYFQTPNLLFLSLPLFFPLNAPSPPFMQSKFKFPPPPPYNIYITMKLSPSLNPNTPQLPQSQTPSQIPPSFPPSKPENLLKCEQGVAEVKKKRKNRLYSKWTEREIRRFWQKNLSQMNRFPQKIHSWNHWKTDRFFHDMSKFIRTKTSIQCKSFDQRMKNQFAKKSLDLPEATILSLLPYQAEDLQLKINLQFLKKRVEGQVEVSYSPSRQVEKGKGEGQDVDVDDFSKQKEKYVEAVRQCIEYFKGEGRRKLEELKREVSQ